MVETETISVSLVDEVCEECGQKHSPLTRDERLQVFEEVKVLPTRDFRQGICRARQRWDSVKW